MLFFNFKSSEQSDSSRSNTFGFITIPRAIATRCCWPPDNSAGYLSSNPFNLRFDEIGKKNFKEISYDNSDSFVDNNFFLNKTNNFNEDLIRRSDSPLSKYKYFDDADNYYFYGPPKRSFFEIENSYLK